MKRLLNRIGILVLILVFSLTSVKLTISKDLKRANCFREALKQLNLSNEQKSKIKILFEKFKNENKSSINEVKVLKMELKNAKTANNQIKIDEIKPLLKDRIEVLKPKRKELKSDIKGILTSYQNTELQQLLKSCKESEHKDKIIK
ncbi:MAG: hypothetical protein IPP08_09820 [Chlorobiota bacterium]|nr:MAG: hypothetical protein IPP08_09820 [Chlorobiota bacterium]